MSKRILPQENVVVTLYNCELKEPIGIFKSYSTLALYLFTVEYRRTKTRATGWTRIRDVTINKGRIHVGTRFDFPVTVRASKEDHKELLGNEDYVIFGEYPTDIAKGFDTDRKYLYEKCCIAAQQVKKWEPKLK